MRPITDFSVNTEKCIDLSLLTDRAFGEGERELYIPAGEYILTRPLLLPSNTVINAAPDAFITAADGAFQKEDSVLIGGYKVNNITIKGGHWNGNIKGNPRSNFKTGAQTGVSFDFIEADGLNILDLVMTDPGSFHIRIGETKNFRIENIVFDDKNYYWCQDGVHVGGFCENGVIRNISALNRSPNDDMIALNADDISWYSQNRGMKNGYIRNILIENLTGDEVYTCVRILSTESEISDITIRNIKMGVRYYFLNLDGARYAADGIYPPGEYPSPCGNIRNILIENAEIYKINQTKYPLIVFETRAENFVLRNFRRLADKGDGDRVPTARFRNIPTSRVTLDGNEFGLPGEFFGDEIETLTVDSD